MAAVEYLTRVCTAPPPSSFDILIYNILLLLIVITIRLEKKDRQEFLKKRLVEDNTSGKVQIVFAYIRTYVRLLPLGFVNNSLFRDFLTSQAVLKTFAYLLLISREGRCPRLPVRAA